MLEYSLLSDKRVTHLFVGCFGGPDLPPAIESAVKLFDDVEVATFLCSTLLPTSTTIAQCVKERDELLRQLIPLLNGIDELVIGHHMAWQVADAAQWAFERGKEIVYVDDGTFTLDLDRSEEATPRVTQSCDEHRWIPALPKRIRFFTAYPEQVKAASSDIITTNDYSGLRSITASLQVEPCHAIIIGQAHAQHGYMNDESARYLAGELADIARQLWPRAGVSYAPHRSEPVEKLAWIEEALGCPIADHGVPFEILPLTLGHVPGKIIGHTSSALITAAAIFPSEVEIVSKRIPLDFFADRLPNPINDKVLRLQQQIYDTFSTRYEHRISVID